ncbi:hypothetical protein B0T25DRAFT_344295 [Lasiosphaeria hispida]|uniref:Uncharacterized protein n=1 Tax=Lasiosphaeria hispida TaxID=260671 RepID=A0AAJ0H6Z6_9PEZI|nr:hypothetical protein B0T25DRAFT_344295 [Lasiosphaeria hispida]
MQCKSSRFPLCTRLPILTQADPAVVPIPKTKPIQSIQFILCLPPRLSPGHIRICPRARVTSTKGGSGGDEIMRLSVDGVRTTETGRQAHNLHFLIPFLFSHPVPGHTPREPYPPSRTVPCRAAPAVSETPTHTPNPPAMQDEPEKESHELCAACQLFCCDVEKRKMQASQAQEGGRGVREFFATCRWLSVRRFVCRNEG